MEPRYCSAKWAIAIPASENPRIASMRRMRSFMVLNSQSDAAACGLQNLEPRKVLVVAFDERPRRQTSARPLHHVIHRALIVGPLRAVAPVFVRELPSLVSRLLARLEAAQLLVLRDVDPVVHHDDPVVDKLLLELSDLGVGAPPFPLGPDPLNPLHQDAAVP